jgi:cytochrome c-type biogenesis protein CcmH/NrfG
MKMAKRKSDMKISSAIAILLGVFCFAILTVPGHALTPVQVFDKVKDSIVTIVTLDAQGNQKAQGSGVILSSGKVATSCCVVEGGASYRVGRGKHLLHATLYGKGGDKDVCLLNAKGIRGKAVELGQTAPLKVGDPVYALGAPRGPELSLSDGVVAQLRGKPSSLIRTTAVASSAFNGGGLFDGQGRLVGLTSVHSEDGQRLTFAIAVERISDFKAYGKAVPGSFHTEWAKRAMALEITQDWQAMLDWCRKWTKREPRNADGWFNMGVAYSRLSRHNEAIGAYRQAVMIDPGYGDAWSGIGAAYDQLKRHGPAADAYRQAVTIDPESANAWLHLGLACSRLERYDEAIAAYRQAVTIDPESAKAWFCIGVAYFLAGDKTEPMGAVEKLRRLDLAEADRLLGLITPQRGEQARESVMAKQE